MLLEVGHDLHHRTHALAQAAATGPHDQHPAERIALARREQLDYTSFLEIIFSDEVNRRAHRRMELRLNGAGFEETCRLVCRRRIDRSASITLDRWLLDAGFSLAFLDKHTPQADRQELSGPGPGLLDHRCWPHRPFHPRRDLSRAMAQARIDNSLDPTFRSFLTPDLLILDDLRLHRLTPKQSADLYELNPYRHLTSNFVIASNRTVDEWLSLFDDRILSNRDPDRLANASYQMIIDGTNYRGRLSLHRTLLGKGVISDNKNAGRATNRATVAITSPPDRRTHKEIDYTQNELGRLLGSRGLTARDRLRAAMREQLVADKESGADAVVDVILLNAQILWDWDRFTIARELDLRVRSQEFVGGDPVAFLCAQGLHERRLNQTRKTLIVVSMCEWRAR